MLQLPLLQTGYSGKDELFWQKQVNGFEACITVLEKQILIGDQRGWALKHQGDITRLNNIIDTNIHTS